MNYSVDYFIKKFEAIPDFKWYTGGLKSPDGSKCCALGHLQVQNDEIGMNGEISNIEGKALAEILRPLFQEEKTDYEVVYYINDLWDKYQLPTPKERILAALNDIKKLQPPLIEEPKVKEVIRYVSVPETIKEQTKELIQN